MRLQIKKFNIVKSTNDEAIKLIKKNHLKPTIIFSEKQIKGRGTMGKKWISKKGNIFISIFFKISNSKITFKQFSMLNPYILKIVLKKYSKYKILIKWPNDLLIKNKKICGVLQEVIEHKEKKFLIIGIGINSLVSPKNSAFKSTSLTDNSNFKPNNLLIIKEIKKAYEKFLSDINKYNITHLKKRYFQK